MTPVGLTKDAGWQAGKRQTLPIGLEETWQLLLSPEGLATWLAPGLDELRAGEEYRAADGTVGEVRSLRTEDRIRVTWQPPERDTAATLQVVVIPVKTGTTVNLHAEQLVDALDRETMLERFTEVHARLRAAASGHAA
ncbi:MAG: SRPBCC domain-containing protein [Solirubrobacteraceae bacterium]|nr:SRPBCC domain-containing protein [Solirubrobacteraceae bacterium]